VSVLKQQIRVAVTNDIGADLDDQLEAAKVEVQQQEGAKAAYATAEKLIGQLLPHLQQDLNDGKIPMETASVVSKWVQRAMGVCTTLHAQATNAVIAKSGAVLQTEKLVGLVKKRFDAERAKLIELEKEASEQPVLDAASEGRPEGRRAPVSIKEQRLREAMSEDAQADAQAVPSSPVAKRAVQATRRRVKRGSDS